MISFIKLIICALQQLLTFLIQQSTGRFSEVQVNEDRTLKI